MKGIGRTTLRLVNAHLSAAVSGCLCLVKDTSNIEQIKSESCGLLCIVNNNVHLDSETTICKLLAEVFLPNLYPKHPQRLMVDSWLEVFEYIDTEKFEIIIYHADGNLLNSVYLAGNELSIADFIFWCKMKVNNKYKQLVAKNEIPLNLKRYMTLLEDEETCKAISKTINFENFYRRNRIKNEYDQDSVEKNYMEEGKFINLPNAEMGKVVVRFPPEASGYLHIGHIKAALLNQFYKENYKGRLIMRFDDTNPAKESIEFEEAILEDLKRIGLTYDAFSHTSDHFDVISDCCEQLIRKGLAYCDDTDPQTMKMEREARIISKNRNNSVEMNLSLWEEMKAGTPLGLKYCVRAKIEMNSDIGCMRDPTIYRCKNESHVRCGEKYKAYPTYDFACPIVDSIEGVTHSLRTTEYHDRDEQYNWFLDALGMRKPVIYEYSRLNLQYTVLSKRKLTWFVQQGIVDGWDDPRFPTLRGVLRRGMTVLGLRSFVITQGSSKSNVNMEWDKIWSINAKFINPVAPRHVALLQEYAVPVKVLKASLVQKTIPRHPKNPDIGEKTIWLCPSILIDGDDAETLTEGEIVTFINWGNMKVIEIKRENGSGDVKSITIETDLDNTNFKNTKKVTWLSVTDKAQLIPVKCVHFEHLITKAKLDENDDFTQYVNPHSMTCFDMIGENDLKDVKKGDIIQIQRRGFFICDVPFRERSIYTGVCTPCVLFNVPDGATKESPSSLISIKKRLEVKKDKAASPISNDLAPKTDAITDVQNELDASDLNEKIISQGNIIRSMKAKGETKDKLQPEIKKLLSLKELYATKTGQAWTPSPPATKDSNKIISASKSTKVKPQSALKEQTSTKEAKVILPENDPKVAMLNDSIKRQGDLVRSLKANKETKEKLQPEINKLLELKNEYRSVTGKDWKAPSNQELKHSVAKNQNNAGDKLAKQEESIKGFETDEVSKAQRQSEVSENVSLEK